MELLELRDAVLVVIAVEILLLVVGGTQMLSAAREYRRDRAAGFGGWGALESSLAVLLPQLAARLIVSEMRLFYCLVRWTLRRTRLGEGEFSCHRRSTMDMFVLLIVLVSPVEVLVIELLLQAFLPLLWLRLLVLFLEVYAVFWILGFYASRVALPHRLEETGLRLYHGIFAEGFIPYAQMCRVQQLKRKAPEWGDGLQIVENESYLAIGGNTNVTLELCSPIALHGFLRPTKPVQTLRLAFDEPKLFVQNLEHRLHTPSPGAKLTTGA
jgi:hypothetical protein